MSAGLFVSPTVHASGFPWCNGETVEIPVASAVAKILCKRHNDALSPVDAGGISVFRALREIDRVDSVRERSRRPPSRVQRYFADGLLMERWFLKTALNIACLHPSSLRWQLDGSPPDAPPRALVEIVFGRRPFPENMGLYFVTRAGEVFKVEDAVITAPLLWQGRWISGMAFEFRGFKFVLSLMDAPMPKHPSFSRDLGEGWQNVSVSRHMTNINFDVRGRRSQELHITW